MFDVGFSFEIVQEGIEHQQNGLLSASPPQEGDNITLKCVADDWYEFCVWRHQNNICKFEWKRRYGEVRKQECDSMYTHRVKFVGEYSRHECTIHLTNVSLSDEGEWICELESYVWGPLSGSKDKTTLELILEESLIKANQSDVNTTNKGK